VQVDRYPECEKRLFEGDERHPASFGEDISKLGLTEVGSKLHPRQKDIDEQTSGFRRVNADRVRLADIKPKGGAGLAADVTKQCPLFATRTARKICLQ